MFQELLYRKVTVSHLPLRERCIYLVADALCMHMKIVSLFGVLPEERWN